MPISPPTGRQPIHTRTVVCQGYLRDDGLWDIEGHIVDTKAYSFHNDWRGQVESGQPVHDMRIRLTVDEHLCVRHAEAVIDGSPFEMCPEIAPNFERLAGLTIKPGWNRDVRHLLGGVAGCTHLVELLGTMATTAYQSIGPYLRKREQKSPDSPNRQGRARIINTCHAWAENSPMVKRWAPEFYVEKK